MEGRLVRDDVRWMATNIEAHLLDAEKVWRVGWLRWEIENGGHRSLKREHHAMHTFCQKNLDTVDNVLLLQMWGQNLLEAFCLRRLQRGRWGGGYKDGLTGLVEELTEQMAASPSQGKWEVSGVTPSG